MPSSVPSFLDEYGPWSPKSGGRPGRFQGGRSSTGAGALFGFSGEFDSCIPNLVSIVDVALDEMAIFEFLWDLETKAMGLPGDETRTREAAKQILALKGIPIQ